MTFAGTLWTPALRPGNGAVNALVCRITNVDDEPRVVSIAVYGFQSSSGVGGVLLNSVGPVTVNPLDTRELLVADVFGVQSPHNCKFTHNSGKDKYRAVGCAIDGFTNADITCVAAD